MVQPKQPPLSIRPGDDRLAKIDAYAEKRGIKRHAAVLELIDRGLAHAAMSLKREDADFAATYDFRKVREQPPEPASKPRTTPVAGSLQLGPTRSTPGERQKGAKK